ncbi:hypothetical protein CCP4SC76_7010011 [Gammaproteobacteria bacterium]
MPSNFHGHNNIRMLLNSQLLFYNLIGCEGRNEALAQPLSQRALRAPRARGWGEAIILQILMGAVAKGTVGAHLASA